MTSDSRLSVGRPDSRANGGWRPSRALRHKAETSGTLVPASHHIIRRVPSWALIFAMQGDRAACHWARRHEISPEFGALTSAAQVRRFRPHLGVPCKHDAARFRVL